MPVRVRVSLRAPSNGTRGVSEVTGLPEGALSSCEGGPPGRQIVRRIRASCDTLLKAFGPQGWWPGDSVWEIMAGAVLTQRTAWSNAELALERLRSAGALDCAAILELGVPALERLVRPAGFYRSKAGTLMALAELALSRGGPERLLRDRTATVRRTLLAVRGIGAETADAIALYAGGHPVFVVDAYARRYATRHGLALPDDDYEALQHLFESALGADAPVLGEYHALIVQLGKACCRPRPLCDGCPLASDLPKEGPLHVVT